MALRAKAPRFPQCRGSLGEFPAFPRHLAIEMAPERPSLRNGIFRESFRATENPFAQGRLSG
jgi:hypothetical protein